MIKIRPRNPFNRRLNIRTRIRAQVDNATVWMDTLDLGLGGALCTSAEKIPMGRPVRCRIQVAAGASPLWVEVLADVTQIEGEYPSPGEPQPALHARPGTRLATEKFQILSREQTGHRPERTRSLATLWSDL